MAASKQVEKLMELETSQLVSVYVGKSGRCACGCSGKHRYWDAEEGTRNRGYEVEPNEVNHAYMRQALGTIQMHPEEAVLDDGIDGSPIWSYDDGVKMYVAYVR